MHMVVTELKTRGVRTTSGVNVSRVAKRKQIIPWFLGKAVGQAVEAKFVVSRKLIASHTR